MTDSEWIKNLKVGDKVFVVSRNFKGVYPVKSVTPTGKIRVNGDLYCADGYYRGDAWVIKHLEECSPEAYEDFRRERLVASVLEKLRKLSTLTYGQAARINAILQEEVHD